MFYLETKDGDRIFTSKDSNDRLEFEKVIYDKLGSDAARLFNNIVEDNIGKRAEVKFQLNDIITDLVRLEDSI